MELKYHQNIFYLTQEQYSSNCTFMELKYSNGKDNIQPTSRSNCTFMELKFSPYYCNRVQRKF